MKYRHVLLTTLAVITLGAGRAFACDCAGNRPACQEYWEVSAVFVGTVINTRTVTVKDGPYPQQMRAVRISLDEVFRGLEGAEVEVLTGFGGGDCGFGFKQAQQYLVYAYRSENDGKLHTSICTRTKSISEANDDLTYIRGLSKAKTGATISGEVMKYLRDQQGSLANQPLPGVKVVIEGEKKFEAVTDAKGQYRINQLPAGEYTIKPVPPDGLAARGPERKIKMADRGCAVESFWLVSNAQLSGRVLNPQGLPVAKSEIFMIEADKQRYQGHWDAAYSDEEGKYSFKFIPPGRYVLLIRFDGMTSQNRPFPRVYYPDVSDQSQAKVFTISEGQRIENYDLEVPPLPPEYDVQGTVVWSNGAPAMDAKVGYLVVEDAVFYGAKIDDEGRFSFKAYEGLKLTIRASIERQGKSLYSDWINVTVNSSLPPVKIVLTAP
jgi:hypothetical protein